MLLRDIVKPDSRLFLKSVYGPLSERWPAMSYSLPQLKKYLASNYRPETDFILYTGTLGTETERKEHRGRLLSILRIDRTKSHRTADILPPEVWQWSQEKYPGQWEYSFGVLQGWNFDVPPLSAELLPVSYSKMGQVPHRGMVRPLDPEERERLMGDLSISEIKLPLQPAVNTAVTLYELLRNRPLNEEANRIANLINNRVLPTGAAQAPTIASRPVPVDLVLEVAKRLSEQPLCCAICGELMELKPADPLQSPTPGPLAAAHGSYGPRSYQLAHLACYFGRQ